MVPALITWSACAVVLLSAVWVVTLRNLFRAALSLGVTLVGVAGLFILLRAEFLAFVQILVYVGAILTLVVFAVMLTSRATASTPTDRSRHRLPALCASALIFMGVWSVSQTVMQRAAVSSPHSIPTAELGTALVTTFVLPFEVISVLFVAAMVGAIAVASSK